MPLAIGITVPQLVLDRGLALLVTAVTGVCGNSQGGTFRVELLPYKGPPIKLQKWAGQNNFSRSVETGGFRGGALFHVEPSGWIIGGLRIHQILRDSDLSENLNQLG